MDSTQHGPVSADFLQVIKVPSELVSPRPLRRYFPSLSCLSSFLLSSLPLSRSRGPARLAVVLGLAANAFFDTPTAWLPYPATVAPLGDRLVGCCTATTQQQCALGDGGMEEFLLRLGSAPSIARDLNRGTGRSMRLQ